MSAGSNAPAAPAPKPFLNRVANGFGQALGTVGKVLGEIGSEVKAGWSSVAPAVEAEAKVIGGQLLKAEEQALAPEITAAVTAAVAAEAPALAPIAGTVASEVVQLGERVAEGVVDGAAKS